MKIAVFTETDENFHPVWGIRKPGGSIVALFAFHFDAAWFIAHREHGDWELVKVSQPSA